MGRGLYRRRRPAVHPLGEAALLLHEARGFFMNRSDSAGERSMIQDEMPGVLTLQAGSIHRLKGTDREETLCLASPSSRFGAQGRDPDPLDGRRRLPLGGNSQVRL